MRRKDREITDINQVAEFLAEQDIIRLALTDSAGTYIVPVNYGFELINTKQPASMSADSTEVYFYIHGSKEGRKASALLKAATDGTIIPFEIDGRHKAVVSDGCDASYRYMSVIGNVAVEQASGVHGLEVLMNSIMPASEYHFSEEMVQHTLLLRLKVVDWSCKRNI